MRVFTVEYAGPHVGEGKYLSCHTIVVADNEKQVRQQMSRVLTDTGYHGLALVDLTVREVPTHEVYTRTLPVFED